MNIGRFKMGFDWDIRMRHSYVFSGKENSFFKSVPSLFYVLFTLH